LPTNGSQFALEAGLGNVLLDGTQFVSRPLLKGIACSLLFYEVRWMEDVYISILLCWRRPGWLGSVNSSSSMGAPFSTMNQPVSNPAANR
jgi:hypothetical protein